MATRAQTKKKQKTQAKTEGYFARNRRLTQEALTKIAQDFNKKKVKVKATGTPSTEPNRKGSNAYKEKPTTSKASTTTSKTSTSKTSTSPSKTSTSKTSTTTSKASPAKITGASYGVKSGDTLSAIAKRAGVTIAAIMSVNPSIKDKNKIQSGKSLKMPASGKGNQADFDEVKKKTAEFKKRKAEAPGNARAIEKAGVEAKKEAARGASNSDSAYKIPKNTNKAKSNGGPPKAIPGRRWQKNADGTYTSVNFNLNKK